MNHFLRSILILAFTLPIASLPAGAGELSLEEAIQNVLKRRPELNISRIDTAIAAADKQRVQGLLDPTINGTITASEERLPISSNFQAAETRNAEFSAGLSQPLSNGGTLAVQGSYSRNRQVFVSPLASQLARFNPAYRSQIDVSYRHALLRGADRPDYSLGLESAEAQTSAASFDEHVVARSLSLSTISAFYNLVADDINVDIAEQAVKRAREILRYQKSRQEFGLIEQADALQAEAFLAARRTDLQRARSQRRNDENALSRLMQQDSTQKIALSPPSLSANRSIPDFDEAETLALMQRPDIKAIDARIKAAEADLNAALDIDSTQLDVVAQLGTRSLDGKPGQAATSSLSVNDHFAALSLEMQDTWGRQSAKASIRKAELARQRLSNLRRQTLELIRDDLSSAITAIETGIPNLKMARLQASAERKKYQAELKRYRDGRLDTATLVQFEGELRNAELQEKLQQQTLQLARIQLAWATGSLLKNLGIEFESGMVQP